MAIEIAGIDLRLVFLRPARPHRALDARTALERLERAAPRRRASDNLRMPTDGDLSGRHTQRHLVLGEGNDEQLELEAGDFLLVDRNDLADAMRRIDDVFTRLEALLGGRFLRVRHDASRSFSWWPGESHADGRADAESVRCREACIDKETGTRPGGRWPCRVEDDRGHAVVPRAPNGLEGVAFA